MSLSTTDQAAQTTPLGTSSAAALAAAATIGRFLAIDCDDDIGDIRSFSLCARGIPTARTRSKRGGVVRGTSHAAHDHASTNGRGAARLPATMTDEFKNGARGGDFFPLWNDRLVVARAGPDRSRR